MALVTALELVLRARDSEESMVAPQPEAVTAGNDVYAAEASAVL
jgi:hypothetical protein